MAEEEDWQMPESEAVTGGSALEKARAEETTANPPWQMLKARQRQPSQAE
jgi:hypothetical protein